MLTPKQAAFVQEYMIDLNATQAVLRAGYQMTEAAAAVHGSKLLRNAKIQKAIQEARKDIEARCRVTADWVLEQIAAIATDEEARTADRLKALELLGKHLGMWEKRQEDGEHVVHIIFEDGLEGFAD